MSEIWSSMLSAYWSATEVSANLAIFLTLAGALLLGLVVAAIILFLKPKDYDAHDVEVSGLYWHFVDLVWMFIFPLVYLMSTKIS